MGKGDKKSKKGKIIMGSYGVRRPRTESVKRHVPVPAKEVETEEKPKTKPKAAKKEKEPTNPESEG